MTHFYRPFGMIVLTAVTSACSSVGTPMHEASAPLQKLQMQTSSAAAPQGAQDSAQNQAAPRFEAALKLMQEQSPDATAALIALSKDFPQYSGPLTDLGILYAHNHQRELAQASFEAAIAANPNNAVAENWLGTLYRENGDFARAEHCYQKAAAARPDYAAAHLNLGILYDVSLHRPQQALAEYRTFEKYAGDQNPMVGVWIKQLETAGGRTTASIDAQTAAQAAIVQ